MQLLKTSRKFPRTALLTTAIIASATGLTGTMSVARAQNATATTTATTATPPATTATPAVVPTLKMANLSANDVAARLSKASGTLVVVDGSVANTAIPAFSTLGGSLPDVLKQFAALLPQGTVVRKILLPALAPNAAPPSADVIVKLASVNDGLVGPVMGAKIEMYYDSVNVMGRVMTINEAAPVIAALNLKPVYLVANPNAGNDPVQKMMTAQTEALKTWMAMTPDQRAAVADKQLDGLLNMDSATRQAMFAQQAEMGQKFIAKIQSLPDGQRQQFWKDITGGKFDGTALPGGGKPGVPGGGGGG